MSTKLQSPPLKNVAGVFPLDEGEVGFPALTDDALNLFMGMHLLLSQDRMTIIALSGSPESLEEFKRLNDLKDSIIAVMPGENQRLAK